MNKETVRWIIDTDDNKSILFDYNPFFNKLLVKELKNDKVLSDDDLVMYITEELPPEEFNHVATVDIGYGITIEKIVGMEMDELDEYSKKLVLEYKGIQRSDFGLILEGQCIENLDSIGSLNNGINYFHKYYKMVGFSDLVVEYKEYKLQLLDNSNKFYLDDSVCEKLSKQLNHERKYLLNGKAIIRIEPVISEEYWVFDDSLEEKKNKELLSNRKFYIQDILLHDWEKTC